MSPGARRAAGGEVLARATFTVPGEATNVTVEARLRGDVALFVNGCSAGNYANDGGSGIIDVVGPAGCPAPDPSTGESFIGAQLIDPGAGAYLDVQVSYQLEPPVVTPVVSGQLGNAGWYVGDVGVGWTLSGGPADSTVGCGSSTVPSDSSSCPA